MVTFEKILVPYDGSEMSDKALEESVKIAKQTDSKITLLYVVDEGYSPPSTLLAFINEKTSLRDAKKTLRRVLASGVESMFKERVARLTQKGISVDVKVAFGSPAAEIVRVAESEKFGLIVMGSKSRKFLGKLGTLGSIARRVSESSSIPVMLVR